MRGLRAVFVLPAFIVVACDAGPTRDDPVVGPSLARGGNAAHSAGGGTFDAGVVVHFSYNATGFADGSAVGSLHFATVLGGLPIEFKGKVICMAVDQENNRAWIGAVVTENRSTHPSFTMAIHDPGRDVWFRLVDYGNGGGGTADRTTFLGFEGAAGIITSQEYCEAKIWPGPPEDVVDARTGPLLSGNLVVR